MPTQPEQILEDNLIAQLVELGYAYVTIKDEIELYANFKAQLEKHNKVTFSDIEHVQDGHQVYRAARIR